MAATTSGRRNKIAFGLAFAAVVIVPGLLKYTLSAMGYATVGTLIWALGYGLGAVAMWAIWIRPLDLTGPDGIDRADTGED